MFFRTAVLTLSLLIPSLASAQTCGALPNTLTNGTTADASQVMANFNAVLSCVNSPTVPQGRLTLVPSEPVQKTDLAGATTVYYAPYLGSLVPIYNGSSQFFMQSFSLLSAALNSSIQLANGVNDVYVFVNSSTVTLGLGPSWQNATTRGTAAAIAQINGLWTNANLITLNNGSTTYSVAAGLATYVGSIAPSANGQTAMQFKPTPVSGGTNNWLGVWNAYNRVRMTSINRDTGAWVWASATWRAANQNSNGSNNNFNNRITWVDGLGQTAARLKYLVFSENTGGAPANAAVGVTFDSSSTAPFGVNGFMQSLYTSSIGSTIVSEDTLMAQGLHFGQAMEFGNAGTTQFISTVGGSINSTEGLLIDLDM